MRKILGLLMSLCVVTAFFGQNNLDRIIDKKLSDVLWSHKEFVGIPNLPSDVKRMEENMDWVIQKYSPLGFVFQKLPSSSLPVLFAKKEVNPKLPTVLFYFHLDGQPVDAAAWNQENPFVPVLKERAKDGSWEKIPWEGLHKNISDDWRIFGRAAADDKAPIVMFLSALEVLESKKQSPSFNLKIIFDLEEEYGSNGFLSTLKKYKNLYAADYMIIMDGPAHDSNRPTLTFGCRGIATASITTYGSKLPQHSGHYGNYVSNPVFTLSKLLATMKSDDGRVLIQDYYQGIHLDGPTKKILQNVPEDRDKINKNLLIRSSEKVGNSYQEALQYPTLNVRQIGTSWKGKGLKTVIPEYARADLDIRLVKETDGAEQLKKIKKHIAAQGFLVLDRKPTDAERLAHDKIATFLSNKGVNAFRTSLQAPFAQKLRASLAQSFGQEPVSIRTMGGTVPIIPAINELNIPALIVPMVNMDNNQHSPNENIRIANIRQGIKICTTLLTTSL